jgi:hypothetical protein
VFLTGSDVPSNTLPINLVIPTGAYPDFLLSQLSATATYATLRKERRMNSINASNLYRKSGVAQWRDLQFARVPTHQETRTSPIALR